MPLSSNPAGMATAGNPSMLTKRVHRLNAYSVRAEKRADAGSHRSALGVMIGKIRAAGAGHQLFPLCDGIEELNVYTSRYHHGENPHAATEPINDTELQGYVRRTLEMTGGCLIVAWLAVIASRNHRRSRTRNSAEKPILRSVPLIGDQQY